MNKKFISWRRVSTFRQSKSGLGLAAQKEIIRYFIERDGGEWVADYEECYTGKELSGCVELHKAMAHAKAIDAVLIIAKSDRFRNTAEALKIYEQMGDGHIMFCDLPATDKFTLTLFFALAEREALLVSIRTKQALAVKKAQGAKLGASNEKYRINYDMKSETIKKEESMKRGITKSRRVIENRDTQAMFRILKRVFPNYTEGTPNKWRWTMIGTRNGAWETIVQMMQDFKEMDESGATFHKWDFASMTDRRKSQQKIGAYIKSIEKGVTREFNEEFFNE